MRLAAVLALASLPLLAAPAARAGAPEPAPCDSGAGPCWSPPVGARWQYQLEAKGKKQAATGGIDVSICQRPRGGGPCVRPDVFDIDLFVDPALTDGQALVNQAAVDAIHTAGGHALCYVQAGTAETFRPDYPEFVAFDQACGGCLLGRPFSRRFPDEFWLNLNDDQGQRSFVLGQVEARVALCAAAGFDGIEFDGVDAYAQGEAVTGWSISAETQLAYDRALADLAHRYGRTAALKNDLGQLADLLPWFDYAVNEQCHQFDECQGYADWIAAGKAVLVVEYRRGRRRFCDAARAAGFSAIKKARNYSLFARPWKPCD
jgi:Glycoside-hydrolase family GH114